MDIHTRVRDVALELVSAGVWPTVQEVRARLGTVGPKPNGAPTANPDLP